MRNFIRKLYGVARNSTPVGFHGPMTKIAFILGKKPFAQTDDVDPLKKFPNSEKGGLIISADFEMAWAWRYAKTKDDPLQKGQAERRNFPHIIKVLEEYDIPITFATVGHLFLKRCKSGGHDWMARIPHFVNSNWEFKEGDWYDHDPYSDYIAAPEWYAPDLIQMIIDSKVDHEIGSHTFSHIDFSYENCPYQVAEDELKACLAAADGINFKSMVFPGGTWGNIEVLKNHGFQIYRKRCDFELSYPFRDDCGLLVSPSSGCLEHDLRYGWSPDYFIKRLKRYVTKAIETCTIVHLWFHPSLNLYFLDQIFPRFFEFAARQREKGDLWIGTMVEIAEHINQNRVL